MASSWAEKRLLPPATTEPVRLSAFTDYSLRALMFVATAPEGRATIAQIATAFAISENHLVKVVHLLGREGLLFNTRGRGGGLRLSLPATGISLGAVVRLTEAGDYPAECFQPDGGHCAVARTCGLRGAFARALEAFYDVLDGYTLADLISNRRDLVAILHP
jgi:Rrf2 family transcriptional regulator, nitric oxide-sensitive transcriptional repressor